MKETAASVDRRRILKIMGAGALAGAALLGGASVEARPCQGGQTAGAKSPSCSCGGSTDGTPLQFIPKTKPDPEPLINELEKYPSCPYCGMDRRRWHHSRHLIHYEDQLVDATCSLGCAALSRALNIDRGPMAIYAADFGAEAEIKPLTEVEEAVYLIGSDLPGTMSRVSKMAFASQDRAEEVRRRRGGELGDIEAALRRAYLDRAEDTIMIRWRRAERRRMSEQQHQHHP
ncbi:MAG TPA: twin-arginine translocation pathway signal protein [Desulfurivibrio alkaliphilus]|uniref:Twin-arginine translocation pathway signal protein n=1 Tax=Desulfurivibrio alkaliphilus TaxID=427923 RepID=A0A7C2THK8_9BACT|nr:twin-arginine translocation pathway signal protein [Desulfurivibrio alkaliphilus]